ncbi:MAG: enoyl-CoA hydratase/isomerase family protein [Candidatus Eisenbacteria bacterium]|nr:enoyl-CoA hydratase/isomerase family protein [Candidatus Eisenbacteria bacterium]
MSGPAAGAQVVLRVEDHVARVELNRQPVNALDRGFIAELRAMAQELAGRSDVWLVAMTSRQRVFSAGADLKERAAMPEAEVPAAVGAIQAMVRAWGDLPQPLLAGVQGAALGGGLELALAADLIAAADGAVLGFPEVSLGILPGAGGIPRLALRASMGVARRWALEARQHTAGEALADGVVDYVLPSGGFRDGFEQLVRSLAGNAPRALREAKGLLARISAPLLDAGAAAEREAYRPLVGTEDRREALRAFAERRAPRWQGK